MSSGLTVSRLGVQASVVDDLVHGLICLRISIPKENDANHALRWNLFSSKPPKLISEPSLLPLPLPLISRSSSTPRTSRPRALAIASTLLALPPSSSYPPTRAGQVPYLDVSANSGQVTVVLDPIWGKGRPSSAAAGGGGGGGKIDWVVIMEFERTVEMGSERGFTKVMLSLPKCLHSIIRFQITPPPAGPGSMPGGSGGEVRIMTEPKMLALPPSTFSSPAIPYPRQRTGAVGYEDGWVDGEDLGDLRDGQGSGSEGEGEDEDPASWLEGRFQATSQLRLEWAFASPYQATTLQVSPRWDSRHPSIGIIYETTLPSSSDPLLPIEISIPEGWGWRDLEITGPNLVSWSSTDVPDFTHHLRDDDEREEEEEEGPNDSFSTIRHRTPHPHTQHNTPPSITARPQLRTHTSASLMKQTLPVAGDLNVDDFSFEMTSGDHLTIPATTSTGSGGGGGTGGSRPGTPARSPGPSYLPKSGLDQPVAARSFDLIFGDESDRAYMIEGTLVPLPLTLVSGSQPLEIPFIKSPSSGSGECSVICPNATLHNGDTEEGVCDTTLTSIGTFAWTDAYGSLIRPQPQEGVRGTIRVRLHRGQWGSISMSTIFPWPGRSSELVFSLAGDLAPRILKAETAGLGVPRSLARVGGGQEVRLGQGGQSRIGKMVEVVLEFDEMGDIPLPHFQGAEGEMIVELRGDHWSSVLDGLQTPLTRSQTHRNTFHTTLPSGPLSITIPPTSLSSTITTTPSPGRTRMRTLFSLNTFFNLFILWLVVSLGQQVQRLRTEISFVAEEARDLRMYGFDRHHHNHNQHQQHHHQVHSDPEPDPNPDQERQVTESTATAVSGDGAIPTILPDGTDLRILLDRLREEAKIREVGRGVESSLGRVVFGASGWGGWTNLPAVKTLSKGVTRIWEAFAWLIGVT